MITEFPPNTLIIYEKKICCQKKFICDDIELILKIKPINYRNTGTVKIVNNNIIYEVKKNIICEIYFSCSKIGSVKILLNEIEINTIDNYTISKIVKIDKHFVIDNVYNIKIIYNDKYHTEITVKPI